MKIKLLPQDITINAEVGDNLLDLLIENGVKINTRCGKKGICGKCAVTLNGKEVLACTTNIDSDAEVFIPESSRLDEIFSDTALKFQSDKFPFHPRSKKVHLHIPAVEKNLSGDWEKITAVLNETYPDAKFSTPLENLQGLSKLLRDSDGDVTVTLFEREDKFLVTNIETGDTTQKNYGAAVDVGTTTVMAVSYTHLTLPTKRIV